MDPRVGLLPVLGLQVNFYLLADRVVLDYAVHELLLRREPRLEVVLQPDPPVQTVQHALNHHLPLLLEPNLAADCVPQLPVLPRLCAPHLFGELAPRVLVYVADLQLYQILIVFVGLRLALHHHNGVELDLNEACFVGFELHQLHQRQLLSEGLAQRPFVGEADGLVPELSADEFVVQPEHVVDWRIELLPLAEAVAFGAFIYVLLEPR